MSKGQFLTHSEYDVITAQVRTIIIINRKPPKGRDLGLLTPLTSKFTNYQRTREVRKRALMLKAGNEDPDQTAHLRSLIRAFVAR